jgi:nodulation protein E
MRRVAITGAGAISALGRNITEFAEALREGRGGIGQIESTDITSLRFQNGAEVKNYTHQPYFEDRRADFMDRLPRCGDCGVGGDGRGRGWTPDLRGLPAVITGSVSAVNPPRTSVSSRFTTGASRHPLTIPKTMANAGPAHFMEFGITGPAFTISTACSSAAHAIVWAFQMIGRAPTSNHGR